MVRGCSQPRAAAYIFQVSRSGASTFDMSDQADMYIVYRDRLIDATMNLNNIQPTLGTEQGLSRTADLCDGQVMLEYKVDPSFPGVNAVGSTPEELESCPLQDRLRQDISRYQTSARFSRGFTTFTIIQSNFSAQLTRNQFQMHVCCCHCRDSNEFIKFGALSHERWSDEKYLPLSYLELPVDFIFCVLLRKLYPQEVAVFAVHLKY